MERPFIEELEDNLDDIDDFFSDDSSSDDEELRNERARDVRIRMAPFYAERGAIFELFSDRQVYKIFRFDKATIFYLEGIY